MFVLTSLPAPGFAQNFALIIDGLRRAIAARMAKNPAARPVLRLLRAWLSRMAQKFAALAARAQAGKLRLPRLRRRNPGPPHPASDSPHCPENLPG
jgi:hypothetical protein